MKYTKNYLINKISFRCSLRSLPNGSANGAIPTGILLTVSFKSVLFAPNL